MKSWPYAFFAPVIIWCFCVALSEAETAEMESPPNQQLGRLARWLNSPDESVREDAVRELSALRDPAALPLILRCLHDSNDVIRATAAWSLCLASGPDAVNALRKALDDENDRVRASAAWSLSHIG